MTDYQDQEQRERDFDELSRRYRICIWFSGTFWKESWDWGLMDADEGGCVSMGAAETHDAAAMFAHVAWLEVVRGE